MILTKQDVGSNFERYAFRRFKTSTSSAKFPCPLTDVPGFVFYPMHCCDQYCGEGGFS